jgi:hypothetical protein
MKNWIAAVLAFGGIILLAIGYIGINLASAKNWTYIFWGLIVIWGVLLLYRIEDIVKMFRKGKDRREGRDSRQG